MNKYIEDIEYMIKKLEELHPCLYFNVEKSVIDKMISDFKQNIGDINIYQFYYFLKQIFKLINDAHTNCYYKIKTFPFKLKIINGRVYIIDASTEYQQYKYYEIISINNVPINDIMNELEKTISYSTKGWLNACLQTSLLRAFSLRSLPLMSGSSVAETTYQLQKSDNIQNLVLENDKSYNYDHIDDRAYWLDYNFDINGIVIRYRKCQEDRNKTMLSFVQEIQEVVKQNNITDIIIDLRGNLGGDSSVIDPLINYLSQGSFNITTLVDESVFSSGRFAIVDLKRIGSNFVGTEIGTQINAFGYGEYFILPNSGVNISSSIMFWYCSDNKMKGINHNDFPSFYDNEDNGQFFAPSFFIPEHIVENSIEDYISGYDRQLDEAIKTIKEKQTIMY